jgi:hypothetical protein
LHLAAPIYVNMVPKEHPGVLRQSLPDFVKGVRHVTSRCHDRCKLT